MASVYMLVDPRDGLPRYIGQSLRVRRRRRCWLSPGPVQTTNQKVSNWIMELRLLGHRPDFRTIERCLASDRFSREKFWISFGLMQGWPLLNLAAMPSIAEQIEIGRLIQQETEPGG